MKILKTIMVVLGLSTIGAVVYLSYPRDLTAPVVVPQIPEKTEIVHTNNEYGFTFTLPMSWEGYTIVQHTWQGTSLTSTPTNETGPKLLIRNPKWTSTLPYEDIPILVFTTAQWSAYTDEAFAVSAAPIAASELGRNSAYVFALPPRWNFDYAEGYAEAEAIVAAKPLNAFDLKKQ